MFDFHEKRKIRSFIYSKVSIFALLLVAVLMSVSVYNRYTVADEMKAKLETKRSELSELQSRAQLLESKVEYMKDARGIEEELRNRFDVAKEGEQVVVLLDPERGEKKATSSVSNGDNQETGETESFFARLKFWSE